MLLLIHQVCAAVKPGSEQNLAVRAISHVAGERWAHWRRSDEAGRAPAGTAGAAWDHPPRASRRSSERAPVVRPSSTTSPARPLSVVAWAGRIARTATPQPATLTATSGSSAEPRLATDSSRPEMPSTTPVSATAHRWAATALRRESRSAAAARQPASYRRQPAHSRQCRKRANPAASRHGTLEPAGRHRPRRSEHRSRQQRQPHTTKLCRRMPGQPADNLGRRQEPERPGQPEQRPAAVAGFVAQHPIGCHRVPPRFWLSPDRCQSTRCRRGGQRAAPAAHSARTNDVEAREARRRLALAGGSRHGIRGTRRHCRRAGRSTALR